MNKKAQEQVITTVLLILIVLAAIVIVWAVVNSFVTKGGCQIESNTDCLSIKLRFETGTVVCSASGGTITGNIIREGDNVNFTTIRVAAKSKSSDISAPKVLETAPFTLTGVTATAGEQVAVRVAAIVKCRGNDLYCSPSEEFKVTCTA